MKKILISIFLLAINVFAYAQQTQETKILIRQIETLPIGEVFIGSGAGNVTVPFDAAFLQLTAPSGYSSTNQQGLNNEFAAAITNLQAGGGADGNNYVTGATITPVDGVNKSLTLTRQGLTDIVSGFNVADNDNDPINEAQVISLIGTPNPVVSLSQVNGNAGGSFQMFGSGGVSIQQSNGQMIIDGDLDGVVNTIAVTGTNNKTLTMTRTEGLPDLTASFTDNVNDADADASNELQTITRPSANNVQLSLSGGTVNVADLVSSETFTGITGPSVTLAGTPSVAYISSIQIRRNGIEQTIATSGTSSDVTVSGQTVTFNYRDLLPQEIVVVKFISQ